MDVGIINLCDFFDMMLSSIDDYSNRFFIKNVREIIMWCSHIWYSF